MIKTAVEQLAEAIGFDIAHSDDKVQSDLLNGLGKGFAQYNERELSMQLAYVTNKLTPQTKKLIVELSEFIKLK